MVDYGYYELTFEKREGLESVLHSIKDLRPHWDVQERWKDAYDYLSVAINSNLSAQIRNEYVPRNQHNHNYLIQLHIWDSDRSKDPNVLDVEIYPFLDEIRADYNKRDF